MSPQRNLRIVGLALVVGGVSLGAILNRIAHLRARMKETSTRMLTRVEEPGAIATMIGIALLDASDAPELKSGRNAK